MSQKEIAAAEMKMYMVKTAVGDHEPLMVDLEDENGNAVQCEVVDGFAYKENEYAIVENHENGSVYLFKVVGEGDMGELVIPDDAEFDEVSEYYASLEE